jgi:hypothetical protein
VFHLGLQGAQQLPVLAEDGEVEVVVVVRDGDLSGRVDADADGIVGDACNGVLNAKAAELSSH